MRVKNHIYVNPVIPEPITPVQTKCLTPLEQLDIMNLALEMLAYLTTQNITFDTLSLGIFKNLSFD